MTTNKGAEKPKGRPSKFKPEFVEQARKLAILGATDREVAAAITGGEDAFLASWLRIHREDRNGVIAAQKDSRAHSRRERLRTSPSARLRNAVSARLWAALKGRSDGALFGRLGYSLEELRSHLEARFTVGMTWDRYGAWHVDHIRPCAAFDLTSAEDFAACWSLENLQPLWASENVRKGASYGAA